MNLENFISKDSTISQENLFSATFEFEIQCGVQKAFRILSNTSKINKLLKFAPRFEKEVNGKLFVESTLLGKKLEWIEEPWLWESGKYIYSHRVHKANIYNEEYALITFSEKGPARSIVKFFYQTSLKSKLMKFILKIGFKSFSKKYQQTVLKLIEEGASGGEVSSEAWKHHPLTKKIFTLGLNEDLACKLASHFIDGDEDDLFKIQIPMLAEKWEVPEKDLLNAFMRLVKLDKLEMVWEIICPHCQGSRSRNTKLQDLLFENSCEPCGLTFQLDNIELIDVTFKLPDHIRQVREVSFCAAEPFKRSHILLQTLVKKHEKLSSGWILDEKNYRVRLLGQNRDLVFKVDKGLARTEVKWDFTQKKEIEKVGSQLMLNFHNTLGEDVYLVLEEIVPPPYHLSAAKIFNNREFRSLGNADHLPLDLQLPLPSQIILFTDVVDSTVFYQKMGDKKAFYQIKIHFDLIKEVLKEENGVLIKTIGDAVMMTFETMESCLNSIKKVSQRIEEHPELEIQIRYSVHKGPVIAVNYNTGVDYFGDNVNISAKLQALSNANELAFSSEVLSEIKEILPDQKFRRGKYLGEKEGYIWEIYKSN